MPAIKCWLVIDQNKATRVGWYMREFNNADAVDATSDQIFLLDERQATRVLGAGKKPVGMSQDCPRSKWSSKSTETSAERLPIFRTRWSAPSLTGSSSLVATSF